MTGALEKIRQQVQRFFITLARNVSDGHLGASHHAAREYHGETRATLVASIARGRRWLEQLVSDPAANVEGIAKRGGERGAASERSI
jgi:hypothetical protein